MGTSRNGIFDYARGIGIILVVYGHIARGAANAGLPLDRHAHALADSIIYSFHMPLFFFISGFFFIESLQRHGTSGMLRGKTASILYPYVVWSLAQGLIEIVLARHTNSHVHAGEILALLWHPHAHFWFLYTLFGIFLLSSLLYRKQDAAWSGGVLCLAVVLHLSGYSPVDLYLFNSFSHWFVFFALGVSGSLMKSQFDFSGRGTVSAAMAAFLAGQWLFHDVAGLTTDGGTSAGGLAVAVSGILFVLALSRILIRRNWDWLGYLGRHSMEIYLMHVLAGSGMRILLQKVLGIDDPWLHLLLGTVSGLAVPLLLMLGARRLGASWLFVAPLPRRPGLSHP